MHTLETFHQFLYHNRTEKILLPYKQKVRTECMRTNLIFGMQSVYLMQLYSKFVIDHDYRVIIFWCFAL